MRLKRMLGYGGLFVTSFSILTGCVVTSKPVTTPHPTEAVDPQWIKLTDRLYDLYLDRDDCVPRQDLGWSYDRNIGRWSILELGSGKKIEGAYNPANGDILFDQWAGNPKFGFCGVKQLDDTTSIEIAYIGTNGQLEFMKNPGTGDTTNP